jgi:hypothetical protein
MNYFKAGFKLPVKNILTTLSAYSIRSLLFLILLLFIAVYETVLNFSSHAEKLPLLAVTTSVFMNYLVYWCKVYVVLLIPYSIFYIFSPFINQLLLRFFRHPAAFYTDSAGTIFQ